MIPYTSCQNSPWHHNYIELLMKQYKFNVRFTTTTDIGPGSKSQISMVVARDRDEAVNRINACVEKNRTLTEVFYMGETKKDLHKLG